MAKKVSFDVKETCFNCTGCNGKFKILSAHTEETVNIDICSNCHPFYLGQTNLSKARGPAEKLKDKFAAGKDYIHKKRK